MMLLRRPVAAFLVAVAFSSAARADVIYNNTTGPEVAIYRFEGAVQTGNNLAANIDINDLRFAPGSQGMAITSLSFIGYEDSKDSVVARPTIYVWEANGSGDKPGTLLGKFVLPDVSFQGFTRTTIDLNIPVGQLIVPSGDRIWAGIGFDNDNGRTGISTRDLNLLGGPVFHPASVGMDGPQDYYLPPTRSTGNNPHVIPTAAAYGENYGWIVHASVVPEPPGLVLALVGLGTVASLRAYALVGRLQSRSLRLPLP